MKKSFALEMALIQNKTKVFEKLNVNTINKSFLLN